jgi:hypothetical protein
MLALLALAACGSSAVAGGSGVNNSAYDAATLEASHVAGQVTAAAGGCWHFSGKSYTFHGNGTEDYFPAGVFVPGRGCRANGTNPTARVFIYRSLGDADAGLRVEQASQGATLYRIRGGLLLVEVMKNAAPAVTETVATMPELIPVH